MRILGYLAGGLGKEENVATKGLAFLLREKSSRDALADFLQSCGVSHVGELDYSAQDGDHENGIPDLVGRSATGEQRIVLEGKFWAGLTRHQPVSYLNTLVGSGVLAFIVPEARVDYVWRAVVKRVTDANLKITLADKSVGGRTRCATVGPDAKQMVVVAWGDVLRSLKVAAAENKQTEHEADIGQLVGLSEQMGRSGFTPLLPEELTSGVWRRILPLSNLVDEVGDRLESEGVATRERSRLSHEAGSTTLKLNVHGLPVYLCFDANACAHNFATPFWLLLQPSQRSALAAYGAVEPRLLFESDGRPYLALPIRAGVERDEVLDDVLVAFREVAQKLAPPNPTSPSDRE